MRQSHIVGEFNRLHPGYSLTRQRIRDALEVLIWHNNYQDQVAKAVLPVSHSLQRAIEDYGVRDNLCVVPNPVNTRMFSAAASEAGTEDGRKKRVLSVTRLWPVKGTSYLLRALGKVRERRSDFVLDVIGVGPDADEYASLARKLGIEDSVRFRGAKKASEVAQYMENCAFFVQASLVETFGVVYIEAMSCGKPVIACDIPGPNEFINDDVGIMVPPKDVDSLAKAIDYMLDHFRDYSPEKLARYVRDRFRSEAVGGCSTESISRSPAPD